MSAGQCIAAHARSHFEAGFPQFLRNPRRRRLLVQRKLRMGVDVFV